MIPRERMPLIPETPVWDNLEQAVLKTVLYSDLFDYALTPDELAHYLIEAVSWKEQI